ncbi:helix-turn-helix domain-containing protein [uncultured Sphingomonas sp.]|uniref:helix-turn-helix domain-containing protein n=1 Tax=uncultured Sphingomonas sp. TaxID=158754 RepID=UPI0030DD12A1
MTVLLTPQEAAARLHLCTKTLRRLRREGHIRYVAITDRKILYRPEDCDEFVASRARKAAECPSTSRITHKAKPRASGRILSFTARRKADDGGRSGTA